MKKAWVLSYPLNAQQRLIRPDAKADLSLRWRTATLLVLSWGGSFICFAHCSVIPGMLGPSFPAPTPPCPPHDKTNKMACAPSEDSDQPGHPPNLIRVFAVRCPLSAWRNLGSLATHWAHSEDWSDWGNAILLVLSCCSSYACPCCLEHDNIHVGSR